MVEFINKLTGSKMFVAEERVNEYLAAGHKAARPAVSAEEPAEKKATRRRRVKE